MAFAGLMVLWSTARLFLHRNSRLAGPLWPFTAIGAFFLVFFYGSFSFLFIKNPVQLTRLGQMFQYYRLFIDAGILLALAWGLPRRVKVTGVKKTVLPVGLLLLWLIPLFITPGNVYRGALPPRPRLIGHRGAASLAPENTLASMQKAAGLGIYGLETDISITSDGILFLMHDNTLARTTDVAQVIPGRMDDPSETFTWSELTRLDAGSWFTGWPEVAREPIPALDSLLQIVKQDDLHFIYDLRIPTANHPYATRALNLCLQAIQRAGVTDRTWVLAIPEAIPHIRSILPEAIFAYGIGYTDRPASPASLVEAGYKVVNSAFGLSAGRIRAYQVAGLWVNLWVVDEPWQYSRLWLAGANSVTSNVPQDFKAMPSPVLAFPYRTYLLTWGLFALLAAAVYWRSIR
jgi:glycerophosphoryl diester phosphodiesterase